MPILRIFCRVEDETHVFGVCVGWKKHAVKWKAEIEKLIQRI